MSFETCRVAFSRPSVLRRAALTLLSCAGLLGGPELSLAQSTPTPPVGAAAGNHELHRQRQERLIDEQRQRLNELQRSTPIESPAPGASLADSRCFSIERIEIEGAPLLKAKARAKLLAPFEGRCLSTSDIDAVLRAITEYYLRRGYVTTRASLPEQDLGTGRLRITVIEGVLENLLPAPGSSIGQRELNIAFPGRTGEVLNLREIEQLLDQLNRLPSRQSTIELEPGSYPGASSALIKTPDEKSWRVSLSRHNQGETSTGRHMLEAGLVWDSPLSLADQVALRVARGLSRSSNHGARNASLSYSLPWGWWNAAYSFLYSDYNSGFSNGDFSFESSGKTRLHNLRVERTLHRGETHKTGVNVTLDHIAADNYIEDIKLSTASPRLTEIGIGVNHGQRLGSTYINLDLGWQRGLALLGADRDRHLGHDDAHAQYNKYTLAASLMQPFTVLSQPISFESLASWQKSDDVLHSQRRVSLGGTNSVRGFQDQSLMGDSGGYWRNQLVWSRNVTWLQPVFQDISAALAWDIGKIQRDSANRHTGQYGTLSGHALELSARSRYARASLTFARTEKRPNALDKREAPFWFRLDLTY
jgi:hemolysin activation/secretion protein